ncbi:MAG: endonuclease/exonuclease/phosphatase family protein [Paludibacteraceae bacterium]
MKFLKGIFLLLNTLAVFALVLVKVGTVVNPNTFMLTAYLSLGLLPLLIINVGFIIFWLLFRKWYFLLSLVTLIVFNGIARSAFPIHVFKPEIDTENYHKIKVLSYNTMTTGSLKKHLPGNPNPVITYILDTDADVVCLQEFAFSKNENQFQEDDFERLFVAYPHKHVSFQLNKWNMNIGVATLSKYPIIEKRNIDFNSEFNLSIFSDIVIDDDTIRFVNNHLESNRITIADMKQTAELRNDLSSEKVSSLTKYFSRKLSIAYKVRSNQADTIAKLISESPYKIISCGDYNDVPASYTYTKIKGNLKDAFKETGNGTGWTFAHSLYRFRIDYIMFDKSFTVDGYKMGNLKTSDHFPIQTNLYLSKNK